MSTVVGLAEPHRPPVEVFSSANARKELRHTIHYSQTTTSATCALQHLQPMMLRPASTTLCRLKVKVARESIVRASLLPVSVQARTQVTNAVSRFCQLFASMAGDRFNRRTRYLP